MGSGIKSSESISIGVNIVQMMILAARKERAMLPIMLPNLVQQLRLFLPTIAS
jgi:hypothetical protein